MSFIVNRPKVELKLDLTRTDVMGRRMDYTLKAVR